MTKQRPIPDLRKPSRIRDSFGPPGIVLSGLVLIVLLALAAWLLVGCYKPSIHFHIHAGGDGEPSAFLEIVDDSMAERKKDEHRGDSLGDSGDRVRSELD